MDKNTRKVDIIIPVYKPDEKFKNLMYRLERQNVEPNHIYIIHTMPDEGEEQWVEELFEKLDKKESISVKNITKSEFNHGGTRNMGADMAEADFVMMMTQDAVPADTRLLEKLLEPFDEEKVAVAYARQLATRQCGVIESYTREFNYPPESFVKSKKDMERLGIKTYFCSDVCAIYRKSTFRELGGFVTETIFNEDMIFASKVIKAGYSIAYAADAKVYHAHKYTYGQQFHRNFDLGVSQRQYHEIFDEVKSESEGIKLVKKTMGYLLKEGHPFYIPDLILQSGFKFLGFQLGKRYDKLPLWLVKHFSMQKSYWEKGKE